MRKESKLNFYFAALCFSVGLYDIACIGLYNSLSVTSGVFWQNCQYFSIEPIATSILYFTYFLVDRKKDWLFHSYIAIMAAMFGLGILFNTHIFSLDDPIVRQVNVLFFNVTYFEARPGLLMNLLFVFLFIGMVYIFSLLVHSLIKNHRKDLWPLIIGFCIFFISTIMDILIAAELVSFIYTAEYSFLVIVIMMDYTLIRRFVSLFLEIENININLEEKVAERTSKIQGMADEVSNINKQYRTFFSTSRDCVYITSLDGSWIDMNDAAVELFGYSSRDELMQVTIANLYAKAEERTKHINTIMGKGYSKDYPADLRKKDGEVINVLITSTARYDTDGKTIGFMGTIKDITERKKAEDTLRESEKKYRTILENMDDVYFEVDIKGNITFVNPSSCKMSGYSEEELIGMSFKNISAPDDIEMVMQYFGKISLTGKTGKPFLWKLVKKNGEQGFFELVASLIRDKQSNPIGFKGIGRDITERKRAEEKLQQTLEILRNAVGVTIQVMVSAVEVRDPYTAGHQLRVADLARAIATEMGLCQDKIEGIRMAGSIHDIGKLSIPAEILSKPTKLTAIEFSLIKEHAQSGYEMLKNVESPWQLAQIVYQHHERMNGSGYPRNLKGDEILLEARIMAVADVVESMASHRPYRPALGIEAALEEIEKNKGILYDDAVVDACLKLFKEKGYKLK
jgi:PAS domain S-box-containing protein/putative nucleotidyltransferase with HDIG domain